MKLASLVLVFVAVCYAQRPATGNAAASGTCILANTGTVDVVNFNCTNLTPQQRQLLLNVPDLINKLLAQQQGSTMEILSRLDTCIAQGAPRAISAEQRRRIIENLANPPGAPEIRIRATNSNNESSRYAGQLHEVFANTPGWVAPPVFENMVAGETLPTGIVGVVNDNKNIYGIAVQRLFKEISIPIEFGLDSTLPPNVVILVVYQKPIS
jgi:hypothetical protein